MSAVMAIGGRHDLAQRWSVSRQRVAQLTAEESFPEPVGTVNGQPVWLLEECDAWRDQRPGPGRPKTGHDRDPA